MSEIYADHDVKQMLSLQPVKQELEEVCESAAAIAAEIREEKVPKRRRKKIRRLAGKPEDQKCSALEFYLKEKRVLLRVSIATTIICIAVALALAKTYSGFNAAFVQDFINSYRRHYNELLYGTHNYCNEEIGAHVFERIKSEQILHQDQAIFDLERALRNDSQFISLAFVGPSGVGKSLLAYTLQKNFPWPENIHSYTWNTYVEEENERFHIVRLFNNNLSSCGRNLLIFDNLAPCQREVVSIVNSIVSGESAVEDNILGNKYVIVIYIFNLNAMEPGSIYNQHHKLLQDLPQTQTIDFKVFREEQLKICIRREAQLEHMYLSNEKFNQIMQTIDVVRSGCKNVRAKVVTHGVPW